MIQRIQSAYLSLTILLSLLFLKGSFLTFIDSSGSVLLLTMKGLFRSANGSGSELIEKMLPLSALMILIPLLALATILMYKNRKIQLLLALIGIVLSSGLILASIYYSYIICIRYNTSFSPELKTVIPILILIFNFLAYRGIRKDDRLVKSYDRLR
jgi:hypothetical protein